MYDSSQSPILICICGISGAIGSTIIAGSISKDERARSLGLVTESPLIQQLGIRFPALESFVFAGWDLRQESLLDSTLRHNICPNEIKNSEFLSQIYPRPGISKESTSIHAWIQHEVAHIQKLQRTHKTKHIIIVNVLPTENNSEQNTKCSCDWKDSATIEFGKSGVTVSRIYFRLAIEAGAHFLNFTPNIAEIPELITLADERGILYAGRDGKTGQTFLKTLIAPAFRDRNLLIDGWFSTNILGNEDGKALNNPDAFLTKQKSKSESLSAILGYEPGGSASEYSHHVHIHYYPPRGDAKESWDNIDFSGFLGSPMQMKINWLGKDSILAAPLVIDMIRIISMAADAGKKGCIEEIGYFFKSPLTREKTPPIHEVFLQFQILLDFIRSLAGSHNKATELIIDGIKYQQAKMLLPLSQVVRVHTGLAGTALQYESCQNPGIHIGFDEHQRTTYYHDLILSELKTLFEMPFAHMYPGSVHKEVVEHIVFQYSARIIFLISEKHGGNKATIDWAQEKGLKILSIPFQSDELTIDWVALSNTCEVNPLCCVYVDWPHQVLSQAPVTLKKESRYPLIINLSYHFKNFIGSDNIAFLSSAEVLLFNSHIPFPGTGACIILSNNQRVLPGNTTVDNQRLNGKYVGLNLFSLAIALVEFEELARKFADSCKENTNAISQALGYSQQAPPFTTFLQLPIQFDSYESACKIVTQLTEIFLVGECLKLPGNQYWGILLSLENATLLGLKEHEARIIGRVIKEILDGSSDTLLLQKQISQIQKKMKPMSNTPDFVKALISFATAAK